MEINWQELIDQYPEKKERILKLEQHADIAKMKVDLANHAGMKILLEEIQSEIEAINNKLLSNHDITEHVRSSLLARRSAFYWFLLFCPNAERTILNINKAIQRI